MLGETIAMEYMLTAFMKCVDPRLSYLLFLLKNVGRYETCRILLLHYLVQAVIYVPVFLLSHYFCNLQQLLINDTLLVFDCHIYITSGILFLLFIDICGIGIIVEVIKANRADLLLLFFWKSVSELRLFVYLYWMVPTIMVFNTNFIKIIVHTYNTLL